MACSCRPDGSSGDYNNLRILQAARYAVPAHSLLSDAQAPDSESSDHDIPNTEKSEVFSSNCYARLFRMKLQKTTMFSGRSKDLDLRHKRRISLHTGRGKTQIISGRIPMLRISFDPREVHRNRSRIPSQDTYTTIGIHIPGASQAMCNEKIEAVVQAPRRRSLTSDHYTRF
jgi:hypothetical protein